MGHRVFECQKKRHYILDHVEEEKNETNEPSTDKKENIHPTLEQTSCTWRRGSRNEMSFNGPQVDQLNID